MGQAYGRTRDRHVFRIPVPQLTFPNGASGATLTQTEDVTINGIIKQMMVGLNDNTGNKTVVVSLIDALTGSVLFSTPSIAEGTDAAPTVVKLMNIAGDDLPLRIICAGTITVSGLISGDPGTSTGLCDIILMGD